MNNLIMYVFVMNDDELNMNTVMEYIIVAMLTNVKMNYVKENIPENIMIMIIITIQSVVANKDVVYFPLVDIVCGHNRADPRQQLSRIKNL